MAYYQHKSTQTHASDPELIQLGQQLATLGYLKPSAIGDTYTEAYKKAVQTYQKQQGVKATGVLSPTIINEIKQATYRVVEDLDTDISNSHAPAPTPEESVPTATFFGEGRTNTYRKSGYAIVIEIGDHAQHVKHLIDVRYRSKSLVLDASGNPIAETIEFIAQDLRENTESTD